MKFQKKPKQPKSAWTRAFPEQVQKLHPAAGKAGGVKARSPAEEVRMAVYRPIAELYKQANPMCQCCEIIFLSASWRDLWQGPQPTEDIHHTAGREGYLLFDIRYFKAACRGCHDWIHAHPAEATKLKLLITL